MKALSGHDTCAMREEDEDWDLLEAEAMEAQVRENEDRERLTALRPLSLCKKVSIMLLVLTCFDGFVSCKTIVSSIKLN